jgi:NitT/TauT family transport system permease protein
LVQRSLYPYAIFLQTVPIVGIAPLVVVWFGFGFQSVVVVALIISLFPIITNVSAGLTTIDRSLLELFEMHGASRWQTLTKLRFPSAVPFLVTGARTSAGLSVVGALVGEMFAGAGLNAVGLGSMIQQLNGQLDTPYLFAAILASTLLGLLIFGAVDLVGSWALGRWHGEKRRELAS